MGLTGNVCMDWFRYNAAPVPPPGDQYVTEDGTQDYVTEDGTGTYVPET